MAAQLGVSPATVRRVWAARGLAGRGGHGHSGIDLEQSGCLQLPRLGFDTGVGAALDLELVDGGGAVQMVNAAARIALTSMDA